MRDIDLGPDDYRKRDPRTGKWLQNVDRKLCRWGSVGSAGMTAFLISLGSGDTIIGFIAVAIMAFVTGGLFTLSLKNPDW